MNVRSLVLGLALGTAPATLPAQTLTLEGISDSALHLVVGDSAKVRLYLSGATGGLSEYQISLFVDTGRVQLIRADSFPGSPLPAPVRTAAAPDRWNLSYTGPGTAATGLYLGDLWFRMNSAATQGSFVSLQVNTLKNQAGGDLLPGHRTGVMEVCQAISYWGDVTGERVVNSRDALIALTASVGRSVGGGFDLSYGDVDADSMVTSRDALIILSHSIRLYTGYPRAGSPRTNRCAPLHPVADSVTYFRYPQLYRIARGDTLPSLFSLPLAPYDAHPVVWSPDGQSVLWSAYTSPYYYEVVTSKSPFTVVDTLTRNGAGDYAPQWSPDGTRIAFISDRSPSPSAVYVMDADGSNQQRVTFSPYTVLSSGGLSWSPDGKRVAFVGYTTCCYYTVFSVNPDSTTVVRVLADSTQNPSDVAYTPVGDSIVYANQAISEVHIVPAGIDGTSRRVSPLAGGTYDPGASSQGPVFRWYFGASGHYDMILRRSSDGRHLRHRRNENAYSVAFRRSSVYVSSVSVSPQSQGVNANAPSFTATATVTNSDASINPDVPLSWISRDGAIAAVDPTGPRTAVITGVGTTGQSTYVVVSAGGWRSDSVLVTVIP